jgi:hypothetical protein
MPAPVDDQPDTFCPAAMSEPPHPESPSPESPCPESPHLGSPYPDSCCADSCCADSSCRRSCRTARSLARSPLETAEDSFAWLVTGPRPLAVHGRLLPGLPSRRVPLHQLRARITAHRLRPDEVDAVWAHLVVRARTSRHHTRRAAWTVGCVGVAMPMLAHVAARHALRYRADPADIEAAVISAFVVELAGTDICVPRIPHRLCAAAEAAARALVDTAHTSRPATPAKATRAPRATTPATSTPATAGTGDGLGQHPRPAAHGHADEQRPAVTPAVMPRVKPGTRRATAARERAR